MSDASMPHCSDCGEPEYACLCACPDCGEPGDECCCFEAEILEIDARVYAKHRRSREEYDQAHMARQVFRNLSEVQTLGMNQKS